MSHLYFSVPCISQLLHLAQALDVSVEWMHALTESKILKFYMHKQLFQSLHARLLTTLADHLKDKLNRPDCMFNSGSTSLIGAIESLEKRITCRFLAGLGVVVLLRLRIEGHGSLR